MGALLRGVLFAAVGLLDATMPATPATPAVLFVGNSYTYVNDVPALVGNLSLAAGLPITRAQATKGGASLFQHANSSEPNGQDTLRLLRSRVWDAVVLQDQSETAGGGKDTDDDLPPGEGRKRSLAALQDVYAPVLKAGPTRAIFYETWGRKAGDPPNAACCGYGTFLGMNRQTASGYREYRHELTVAGVNASIARCGSAWEAIFMQDEPEPLRNSSVFSCLYHNRKQGAQCLIDGLGLGGHPSLLGSYMNACVIWAALFGRSPIGLWAPTALNHADATLAQRVAWSVHTTAATTFTEQLKVT